MQDVHLKLNPGLPFDKKKALSTSKLGLIEGKKSKVLYLEPSFVWTLLKVDQKYLQSFVMHLLEKDGEDVLDRSCEK